LFDDAHRAETLRTLGRYASNPELSFTWYDAAVLSQKIRQSFPPPTSSPTCGERPRFELSELNDASEIEDI
jgi:hypothetical protein